MTVSPEGFLLQEPIYENRNSSIFRAIRLEDCLPVIVKHLKEDYPSPEELTRYRQEYEITRDLDCPGIIHTYGLIEVGNTLAIVLEDFGGFSLKMLWPNQALPLLAFFPIAIHAAEALGRVHEHRVIHKDINPANLIYNPKTGILKLIDFGIATRLRKVTRYLDQPENLEGTPAYMSPEQTGRMNRAVDYRTDFYSLGATFYHLLCGVLPFEETDPMALVHCHIARYPKPPHQRNGEVPKVLSDLIMRLMAKHAEERYQSAWALVSDLKKCYTLWQDTGAVPAFPLGLHDFSPHFELSQKIYGRNAELSVLNKALENTLQGASVFVRLSGYSGVGKTALVQELFKPLTRCGGFFISGKFDQFRHGRPCSAFLDALDELAGQLMSLPEEKLAYWKQAMMAALKNNGRLITDAAPALKTILGPQPELEDVDAASKRNRMMRTLSQFLKAFCRPGQALVLFVDDLQWADNLSLDFLEWLAGNHTDTSLLIIGAWRNNEVDAMHPLSGCLSRIDGEPIQQIGIDMTPLTPQDVGRFISDSLCLPEKEVAGLRRLVYTKTGGNPFFMNHFLENLYEEGLLVLKRRDGRARWTWDEEAIHAKDFSDNLVDLMVTQICRHAEETRRALQFAACLGNRFELDILALILEQSPGAAYQSLVSALQEGLILPLSRLEALEHEDALVIRHFKFSHDRVQQAAWHLIHPDQLAEVQYGIGCKLLHNLSEEQVHIQFLKIVDLLNQGADFIEDPAEKIRLTELNYRAGLRAMDGAAHGMARDYFHLAMDNLGDDVWASHPQRTQDLHKQRARAEAAIGCYETAEQFLVKALAMVSAPLDRAALFLELGAVFQAQQKYKQACAQAVAGLALLGIEIPQDVTSGLPNLYTQIDQQLARTDIRSLEAMTDPASLMALHFIDIVIWSCYLSDRRIFYYLLARLVLLTLESGHSLDGIVALSSYSGLLKALGKLEASANVGLWAENLRVYLKYPMIGPNPGYAMKEHRDQFDKHMNFFQDCLESGRLFTGANCLSTIGIIEFFYGRKVDQDRVIEQGLAFAHRSKVRSAEMILKGLQFAWWNLTGPKREQVFGSPEEAGYMAGLEHFLLCIYTLLKAEVLFTNGQLEEAVATTRQAERLSSNMLGTGFYDYHQWMHHLIMAAGVSFLTPEERQDLPCALNRVLKKWAVLKKINEAYYGYQYSFIQAELERLDRRPMEALNAYKQALDCHGNEHSRHEGLIHERLAHFWREQKHETYAMGHLLQAWQCFRVLGLQPKIESMEVDFAPSINRGGGADGDSGPVGYLDTHETRILDLHSVIKAGQAISGKLHLADLLPSIMDIVIENAGAEKGALILMEHDAWVVKARGTLGHVCYLAKGIPLLSCDDISLGAVQYVAKSNEPLMLDDAGATGVLVRDAHVCKLGVRSLLCLPIPARSRGRCLLYLENNITAGAFREQQLSLLETLTTQMAISLENALLYTDLAHTNQTLEEKVVERTKELRIKNEQLADKNKEIIMAQQQLVVKEKMASLGVLTAGVAHEINNPTNFVHGGSQNLERQLEGFRRFIMELAEDAPQEVRDSVDARLGPLFEQCRLIMEGTGRINQIVRDLRLFTRKDEAPVKRADINQALTSTVNLIRANYQDRVQFLCDFKDQVVMDCRPAELNQVFMNLLVNACDAIDARFGSAPGQTEGRILIMLRIQVNHAVITIEDNGCGMTEEVRKKIFEPFYTTKSVGDGTGLGLSISYGIINKHQGQIEVHSAPNQGTRFTLHLPLPQA